MTSQTIQVPGLEGEIRNVIPTRLALIGCGGHAYRNVLPPLRQIPEAVVTAYCDMNVEKAELYARASGSSATAYSDVGEMLAAADVDAVLCVVGFDDNTGDPLYPPVVEQVLHHGIPVWMEKPPASDADGVRRMIAAAERRGAFAQVGFKKVYSPGVQRLWQISRLPEFGRPTQFVYNYDVDLPAEVGNLRTPAGRRFLDDFVHVASVLDLLLGAPALVQAVRGPSGAGLVINQYADGAIGTVALSHRGSGLAPVERLQLVGEGATLSLENGAELNYYPPGNRGPYGTSTSYLPPVTGVDGPDFGPRRWSPEFSLGNLHGGSHFLQGYYHQMRAFVDAVRDGRPPALCGLDMALRVMSYIDTLAGPFGEWRPVPDQPAVSFQHSDDEVQEFACPCNGTPMVLKDGWNYVCRTCGRTLSGQVQPVPTPHRVN